MERIVTFEVAPTHFVFADLLAGDADVRMRFDRGVPAGTEPLGYLWVRTDATRDVADAGATTDRDALDPVGTSGEWTLYRVDWEALDDRPQLYECVVEADAFVRSLRTTGGRWRFSFRFASTESVSWFRDRCLRTEIPIRVTEIRDAPVTDRTILTDRQRELLRLALDRGYYEVPRQATLEDLADELSIGLGAVSEGLRRAEERIVSSTL